MTTPAATALELLRIVFPQHVNPAHRLYGGRLMYWIAEAGTLVASRHQRGPVVLGAMEDIDITAPVGNGDRVAFDARVQATFSTSMEVRVVVTRATRAGEGPRETCRAHLTFVAMDEDGRPTPARPVAPESEEEAEAHRRAALRRERRLARLEARPPGPAEEAEFTAPAQARALRMVTPDMMLGEKVFAGEVLMTLDEVAAMASHRYCRSPAVTASVDAVDFHNPIRAREFMRFRAAVNHVGRSSMEVGVRVAAEDPYSGSVRRVCTAFATFVAIGEDGRPASVPPYAPGTADERARFEAAEARREARLRRLGR